MGPVKLLAVLLCGSPAADLSPVVEIEETVATCEPPNNGAGPLWCYGAPLIVRWRDAVFASIMETGEGVPPLSNTRWRLFRRGEAGWEMIHCAEGFREREPCPLVAFADGRLFLSVNPSTAPPGTPYGPCDPHLIAFSAADPRRAGGPVRPKWPDGATFTDHSYRGIASDGESGEILALNIDARTGAQHWSFRDREGAWVRSGSIAFPIRACYPQVALRNRAAHVEAIGDIVEPVEAWRRYKREKTGRDWDYVFRRLFYAWTPEISKEPFRAPIEVDDVESRAGHIGNLDLWIDGEGRAHLLYGRSTIQSALLRDRFFPGEPIIHTLEHVVIRGGELSERETLLRGGEGAPLTASYARFQATDDGRLLAVLFVSGTGEDGRPIAENRIAQVLPRGADPIRIELREPFPTFFLAYERGGSKPSRIIDIFGVGQDGTKLRYARVRVR